MDEAAGALRLAGSLGGQAPPQFVVQQPRILGQHVADTDRLADGRRADHDEGIRHGQHVRRVLQRGHQASADQRAHQPPLIHSSAADQRRWQVGQPVRRAVAQHLDGQRLGVVVQTPPSHGPSHLPDPSYAAEEREDDR
jgi:hypothetical protein